MTEKRAITQRKGSNLGPIGLKRIISGGQTGADQGGLSAAKEMGFRTGGRIPKTFLTEDGPSPWLKEFGLVETEDYDYRRRTYLNILESDATLLFSGRVMERGVSLTFNTAMKLKRPLLRVSLDNLKDTLGWSMELERARNWFDNSWTTMNVAGPRESRFMGARDLVHNFLLRLLARERLEQALGSRDIVTDFIFSSETKEV